MHAREQEDGQLLLLGSVQQQSTGRRVVGDALGEVAVERGALGRGRGEGSKALREAHRRRSRAPT